MTPDQIKHGTNGGHQAHLSLKVEMCDPCREAHNAYRRGLWRKKYLARTDALYIDSTGTVRRIRALQAIGWRLRDIDTALGHNPAPGKTWPNYSHNLTRQPQVHRDTAKKVAKVYDRLSMQLGPSERTRVLARKYGWVPPLCWDESTIDNPAASPVGAGYVGATRAEALADLVEMGAGISDVCARLKVSRDGLEKWAARHDMSHLFRELLTRETPVFEYRNQHTGGAA